jgi:hypothetical protein
MAVVRWLNYGSARSRAASGSPTDPKRKPADAEQARCPWADRADGLGPTHAPLRFRASASRTGVREGLLASRG